MSRCFTDTGLCKACLLVVTPLEPLPVSPPWRWRLDRVVASLADRTRFSSHSVRS